MQMRFFLFILVRIAVVTLLSHRLLLTFNFLLENHFGVRFN